MPERIQLKRAKGWRMPPSTAKVDRTTKWGNPFRVGDRVQSSPEKPVAVCFSQAEAVAAFEAVLMTPVMARFRETIRTELAGKNLACWCAVGTPCHADVLLRIANTDDQGETP